MTDLVVKTVEELKDAPEEYREADRAGQIPKMDVIAPKRRFDQFEDVVARPVSPLHGPDLGLRH